jgi:thioredoxin reductase (NADPH)
VPITLGTPFLGGARATQPTRVLRVDPRQYHALAAACPQVAETVAAKARERMGGLQGLAARPPRARATLCSQRFDTSCHELRRFLARNQVPFDWVRPTSPITRSNGEGRYCATRTCRRCASTMAPC